MDLKKQIRLYTLYFITLGFIQAESIIAKHLNLEETTRSSKTLLQADTIEYSQNETLVVAKGNVEIAHENKTIYADQVTYDRTENLATATGHVRLHDQKNNVLFLSYIELTGDLKEALAKEVRGIMADNALIAAHSSKRKNATVNVMDHVVYSPCALCKKDPTKPPLWQIKSRQTLLDEESEDMIHKDSHMEMFGFPVFYAPYLRHPGPTVKKRSGVLAPFFGGSQDLGFILGVPYFWEISEDKDLTITPVYISENPLLILDYRQKFCRGFFNFETSFTESSLKKGKLNAERKTRRFRSHVDTQALVNINQNWRAGFDIKRALDDTYFRRYKFLGYEKETFLASRLYGEGFYGRHYTLLEGYTFQDLRQGEPKSQVPYIAPSADLNMVWKDPLFYGTYFLDTNFLNLTRERGTKMQRLGIEVGWHKEIVSSWGSVTDLGLFLRQNLYNIQDFNGGFQKKYSGQQGRFFPQAVFNLKYPLIKFFEKARLIIEPIVGIVTAPNMNLKRKIPVEDSGLYEFSDTNLFSRERAPGWDFFDTGTRLNWGVKFALFSKLIKNSEIFLGQSYAFKKNQGAQNVIGLRDHASDYVARASLNFTDWVAFESRNLFSQKHLTSKRSEQIISVGQPIFRVSGSYVRLPKILTPNISSQQMTARIDSQMTEFWSSNIYTVRELGHKGGRLAHGGGVTYKDECFEFTTTLTKKYYIDRDVKPGFEILFRLVFKNLGDFQFTGQQIGIKNKGDADKPITDLSQTLNIRQDMPAGLTP